MSSLSAIQKFAKFAGLQTSDPEQALECLRRFLDTAECDLSIIPAEETLRRIEKFLIQQRGEQPFKEREANTKEQRICFFCKNTITKEQAEADLRDHINALKIGLAECEDHRKGEFVHKLKSLGETDESLGLKQEKQLMSSDEENVEEVKKVLLALKEEQITSPNPEVSEKLTVDKT